MKAFALTNAGIEDIAAAEIKELVIAANIRGSSSVVTFDIKDFKDFCVLAYRSQSLSRLCYSICEFEAATSLVAAIKNLKLKLRNFKISDWAEKDFVVECERRGKHDFNSHDFSIAANNLISEISGNDNVNFKSPSLRFFCCINDNKGFFGIDVAGFDLSKRDYRIFGHSSDLKATVAYALLRMAGFKRSTALLDPFCRSGAIAIEAALFGSGFPVNYYRKDSFSFLNLKPFSPINFKSFFAAVDKKIETEKLKIFNYSPSIANVRSSEKNAKIAGINKVINFARVDLEWLELKFEHGTVDDIVSYPPLLSKSTDASKIKRLYPEFFYQASLILSKKGRIIVAAHDADALTEAAAKHDFKLSSKMQFSMGEEKLIALVFVGSWGK